MRIGDLLYEYGILLKIIILNRMPIVEAKRNILVDKSKEFVYNCYWYKNRLSNRSVIIQLYVVIACLFVINCNRVVYGLSEV